MTHLRLHDVNDTDNHDWSSFGPSLVAAVSAGGLSTVPGLTPTLLLDILTSVVNAYVSVVRITTADDISLTDDVVLINAAGSYSLPTPVGNNKKRLMIKRISSGAVVTLTTPAGTIDGAGSYILTSQYDAAVLVAYNSNWWVL